MLYLEMHAIQASRTLNVLLGSFTLTVCFFRTRYAASGAAMAVEDGAVLGRLLSRFEQEERDRLFAQHDWWDEDCSFPWVFADLPYLRELFGFDTLKSAEDAFSEWVRSNGKREETVVNGSL